MPAMAGGPGRLLRCSGRRRAGAGSQELEARGAGGVEPKWPWGDGPRSDQRSILMWGLLRWPERPLPQARRARLFKSRYRSLEKQTARVQESDPLYEARNLEARDECLAVRA